MRVFFLLLLLPLIGCSLFPRIARWSMYDVRCFNSLGQVSYGEDRLICLPTGDGWFTCKDKQGHRQDLPGGHVCSFTEWSHN